MRAFLVSSSLGAACAAALAVPLALPSPQADRPVTASTSASVPAPLSAPVSATAGRQREGDPVQPGARASTRTIPLTPFTAVQKSRRALPEARERAARGVSEREVEPFSLLGITWNDASTELHGTVQVRTRDASGGAWSAWQDVLAHNDHAPDPGSAEARTAGVRGSTAPLWVGRSDAVEVQVVPEAPGRRSAGAADIAVPELPGGLRLEMVDPGDTPGSPPGAATATATGTGTAGSPAKDLAAARANADVAPVDGEEAPEVIPGETAEHAAEGVADAAAEDTAAKAAAPKAGPPYIGPRPAIVTRAGWDADESLREREFLYTGDLKLAFVHHSATGNNYDCSEAPAMIRSIYRYHVLSSGWRDMGYNFLVDRCGTIYEGRAGGVTKPVMGAHTYGFNTNSMGVAVLGTFTNAEPPAAAVRGVSQLVAWKLGLFGVDPSATVTVTSGGGKYPKGTRVKLHTVSGHRDGYNTECPGARLYSQLGAARASAASLQGR